MNIADRVRPYLSKYHPVGMYAVHTDSLVVVPQKLQFTLDTPLPSTVIMKDVQELHLGP